MTQQQFCELIRKMRKAQKAYERNMSRIKPMTDLTDYAKFVNDSVGITLTRVDHD